MKVTDIDVREHRTPDHPLEDLILDRWSPRSFSDRKLERENLMSLFEAARWAPSSYNGQPWRYFYALRGSKHWETVLNLLGEFNRKWASSAGALIILFSRTTFERNGKPSRTHSFDAGAAWQNLCLQGTAQGLVVHGMEGFDYDRAREFLGLSEEFAVEAMAAVGWPGDRADLSESLREKEEPSDRKPVSEFVFDEPPNKG